MWDKIHYNLGEVEPARIYKGSFSYTGDLGFKSVDATCNCSIPSIHTKRNGFDVNYTFKPKKGKTPGTINSVRIIVTFKDDSIQILSLESKNK